jgi:hypothetical protein
MGRHKLVRPKIMSPERNKQACSIEAYKLIDDKEVIDPDFYTGDAKYLYKIVPGLTFDEIAEMTGLEEEEVYSLAIYKYSTQLRNEITTRAIYARNKRLD